MSKLLLIVDDSKVSRMMIRAIVSSKHPEWDMIEAGDGSEALSVAAGKDVSFFSVDLNMPGIDGLELMEKLKPDFPNAKMALMTANIQGATQSKAEALNAPCINKPITEDSVGKMLEYFNE